MNNQMINQFSTFVNNFKKMNKDPQQAIQELLNSGQMSQQEYNQLRQIANQILGTNF